MECPLSNALGSTAKEASERLALRRQLGLEIRRLKEAGETEKAAQLQKMQLNPLLLSASEKKADIMQMLKENPVLASTLAGGLGGAAVGGLTSFSRPKEERQTGHNMLTGGLAGAALGGGGALAATRLPKALFGKTDPVSMPITFPHNGKDVTIDSAKLLSSPELASAIDAKSQRNVVERGVDAVGGGIKSYIGNHPILSAMLGGDVMNSAARRVGQMGEKRHYPMHAGDTIFDKAHPATGEASKSISSLVGTKDKAQLRGDISGLNTGVKNDALAKAVGETGETDNLFRSVRNIYEKFKPNKANPTSLTGFGADGAEASGGFNKGLRFMNKRMSPKARWATRAGLYGGIPLLQYATQQYGEGASNRQALEDLVHRAQ